MKTIKALEPITAYGPDKLALFAGETAEIEDSFADALIDEGKAEEYSGGGSSDRFIVTFTYENEDWHCDKTAAEVVQAHNDNKTIEGHIMVEGENEDFPHLVILYPAVTFGEMTEIESDPYIAFIGFEGESFDDSVFGRLIVYSVELADSVEDEETHVYFVERKIVLVQLET